MFTIARATQPYPSLATQSAKHRVGDVGGDQGLEAFVHTVGSFFVTGKANLHLHAKVGE